MDSDLQHAADKLANRIPIDACERQAVAEAARKYANPNYEAMLRLLWEHFYQDMEGNPSDPDEAWEYNKEWSEVQMVGLPESLWTAALGITEDE